MKAIKIEFKGKNPFAPVVIDDTWLHFTMENGGTITLSKTGTPTAVSLEYSKNNGKSFSEWTESNGSRTLTIESGETVHIRSSVATTGTFSTDGSNYYKFSFSDDVVAGGDINSLLCKNPADAVSVSGCFASLFEGATTMTESPLLTSTAPAEGAYENIFKDCSALVEVTTNMTDITATDCIKNWMDGVAASGDLYCPESITLAEGASGIPAGWTRHDID